MTRKVIRPSAAGMALAASRPVTPPPLDEGDRIEYGLTVEIKHPRRGSFWPKMGASSTVRPGETPAEAMARLQGFVTGELDKQVVEILGR